ncbi:CBS domain-containing protein [Mariniblastus fucicola]|uniref:Choline transport ATP-binding protein OpuBA n=1 Tax=Mariniblastus fucicola TaxID=980251 RepID=A0A5B9P5I8_9BACT|nr:CBS domain-containing protein [Mariniblastus fucicola]QEG20435.1 Choline transport ATP-binding protein OpuBA [Mariniblastus fucicola]
MTTSQKSDTVDSIMSAHVQTIGFDAPLSDALRLMVEDRFNAIPVINSEEKCVGILSRSDLTETLFAEDKEIDSNIDAGLPLAFVETCANKTVREVMSHDVAKVTPQTSITTACKIMKRHEIHHLPVVAEDGSIRGIVSSFDLMGWIAEREVC